MKRCLCHIWKIDNWLLYIVLENGGKTGLTGRIRHSKIINICQTRKGVQEVLVIVAKSLKEPILPPVLYFEHHFSRHLAALQGHNLCAVADYTFVSWWEQRWHGVNSCNSVLIEGNWMITHCSLVCLQCFGVSWRTVRAPCAMWRPRCRTFHGPLRPRSCVSVAVGPFCFGVTHPHLVCFCVKHEITSGLSGLMLVSALWMFSPVKCFSFTSLLVFVLTF